MSGSQAGLIGAVVPPTNLVQESTYVPQAYGYATAFAYQTPIVKTVAVPGASGVLQTVLSATGRGTLNFLSMANYDTGTRTLRMKVTIDGVVVFDKTTPSTNVASNHYPVVGNVHVEAGSNGADVQVFAFEEIPFNSSLLIEVGSNVTDANSARVQYRVIGR